MMVIGFYSVVRVDSDFSHGVSDDKSILRFDSVESTRVPMVSTRFYKIRPLIRALIIIMDERLPDGIANFKRQPVRLVLLERQLD